MATTRANTRTLYQSRYDTPKIGTPDPLRDMICREQLAFDFLDRLGLDPQTTSSVYCFCRIKGVVVWKAKQSLLNPHDGRYSSMGNAGIQRLEWRSRISTATTWQKTHGISICTGNQIPLKRFLCTNKDRLRAGGSFSQISGRCAEGRRFLQCSRS
jgi:hypothetical protein